MDIQELHRRFRQYCALEKGWSPVTIKGHKATVICFLNRTGLRDLREIDEHVLRDWFYEGRETYEWSASHYRNCWIYLKQFFDWCISRGFTKTNPLDSIERPKRDKRLPRRISKEDAEKLLYTAFNMTWKYQHEGFRNYAMIATLLNCGVRARELLKLEATDVDLPSREILIREGKGSKDRIVFINAKLGRILRNYIKNLHDQRFNSRHFFCSVRGNKLTYKNLWSMLRRVCCHAQVKASCHQLRHTFASTCIENGCNPYELQQIMGHSSFETTERYLSLTPTKAKSNFLKMDLF